MPSKSSLTTTTIGSVEYIDLPEVSSQSIPAKIDTGADSSAIWASDVRLRDGKLQFNFFAPGSAFYVPEPVVTTAFKTASVVNSFGHKEQRYKVRLRVQIGKTKLVRWFSLADRSRNTYPVLLGKNFLKNRFLVDVSRKQVVSTPPRTPAVLVLGGHGELMKNFLESVKAAGKQNVVYHGTAYGSLLFDINGTSSAVLNMSDAGRDIADYALTYFKTHNKNAEMAAAAAEYLKFKSCNFVDREVGEYTSMSKLSEYMRLSCHDLPVPRTMVAKTKLLRTRYDELVETLGLPFVLKAIASDRGRNNFLISNQEDFQRILAPTESNLVFAAQTYIPNAGFLRLCVFGKDVPLAIWRDTHEHAEPLKRHLNKPAGSSNAHLVDVSDISSDTVRLAVVAASTMKRQVAGVDLVQDNKTKEWFILEVNNAPQLRSGSYIDEKAQAVAQFIEKELNR